MKNELEKLLSLYSEEETCLMYLYSLYKGSFNCVNCDRNQFYEAKKYVRVCSICKKKYSPAYGTVFHNVRFGLVKAFQIYIDVKYSKKKITSVEVANRYGLTQRTAWRFMNKIKNADLVLPRSKVKIREYHKLYKFKG